MSKDTDFDSGKKVDSTSNIKDRIQLIENKLQNQYQFIQSNNELKSESNEIDLKEVFLVIWKGWFKILTVAALFSIVSIYYALSLPNIYSSTLKLIPTESKSGNSLDSLASKYGGLASIAGIDIGTDSGTKSIEHAIELITSWPFIETFVDENNLKPVLMATKGWEPETNKLVFDDAMYDQKLSEWLKVDGLSNEPSSYETYKKVIKENVSFDFDKNLGLLEIKVNHYSPTVAHNIAELLKKDLNEYYREQDYIEATSSIRFLKEKIESTKNSQMREVFYRMIESHTHKVMMTEIKVEYLLKTLVPAKVSEPKQKSKPNRTMIVLVSTLLGFFLGISIVVLSNIRKFKEA